MIDFEILFEDDDLVVINKPAGVVVNRAASAPVVTVQDWMDDRYQLQVKAESGEMQQDRSWWSLLPESFDPSYGEPEQVFMSRTGMVHRLDKDTSGVLILGKNPGSMLQLMSQFQERSTEKVYRCLVHGKFSQDADEIRFPIARSEFNRQRFTVTADGRPAVTEFTVLDRYEFNQEKLITTIEAAAGEKQAKEWQQKLRVYEGFSLVECKPKTGRTHQIRVHMSYLQHPLVGDKLYVGKKRIKLDELWCSRQFLHAYSLTLKHPRTNEMMTFTAPLPEDLTETLSYLLPIT
jgi:23S rRNA pseudouridine1911/1915/1917 synthase